MGIEGYSENANCFAFRKPGLRGRNFACAEDAREISEEQNPPRPENARAVDFPGYVRYRT